MGPCGRAPRSTELRRSRTRGSDRRRGAHLFAHERAQTIFSSTRGEAEGCALRVRQQTAAAIAPPNGAVMRNVQTRVVGLVGGGVGCWRVLLQGSAFDLQGRRASAAGRRARRMRFAAARGASGVAASSYIIYTTLRNLI